MGMTLSGSVCGRRWLRNQVRGERTVWTLRDVVDFGMDGKKRRFVVIGESSREPGCLVLSDRGLIRHAHPSNCRATVEEMLDNGPVVRKAITDKHPGWMVMGYGRRRRSMKRCKAKYWDGKA
jgi:hypothetical protein